LQWLRQVFEAETREKANGKPCLLICDGHDSHIAASWIAHCMRNNIILMVLPPHSSHLTQPLDVGVFKPLKTLMASAIEPLVSTELHRILKAEWLSAFVEAHDGAFSIQNIQSGFCGTGIMPFNPSKVIDRVKPPTPTIQESIIIRGSTPIDLTTPFKPSVLTSSPIYNEDTRSANAALLTELMTRDTLSTPARTYAHCVVRREERSAVRNIIIEEDHEKLKAAVTRRKAILSGKRQIVDGKHILTTPEVHGDLVEWEKNAKKRKTNRTKKDERGESEDEQESIDESEASQNERLPVLDCIEVRKRNQ
jgi:DDE superfamily endonuclease